MLPAGNPGKSRSMSQGKCYASGSNHSGELSVTFIAPPKQWIIGLLLKAMEVTSRSKNYSQSPRCCGIHLEFSFQR
ncbi:hypothetical protein TNCV_3392421 [Trichonephila clavipes]|nr:hypothetical protein TNCV_3392421 [Trichonephila clavipes]